VVCYVNYFPVELLEILLIKTAVILLATAVRVTSRGGDVIALTSLQCVCKLWYLVLSQRHWNRRQLRRSFDGTQRTTISFIYVINQRQLYTARSLVSFCRRVVVDRAYNYVWLMAVRESYTTVRESYGSGLGLGLELELELGSI